MDGLRLIVEAVQQRLAEASQAKAQGRTDWWKANTKQCTASLHVFAVFFFSCFLFLITVSVFYLICRRQIATVLLFPCLTFILVWQLREAAILAIGTVANYLHEAKVLQYCFWWLRPCSVPSWFFFYLFISYATCGLLLYWCVQEDLLTFNFEPFLDSILNEDLGSGVFVGFCLLLNEMSFPSLSCIFQFMNFQCDSILLILFSSKWFCAAVAVIFISTILSVPKVTSR